MMMKEVSELVKGGGFTVYGLSFLCVLTRGDKLVQGIENVLEVMKPYLERVENVIYIGVYDG